MRWSRSMASALLVVAVLLAAQSIVLAIDFGPEEIVQAGGAEIQVPGYSVPSFQDWNNDLLKDLIVGEGSGWIPGKVRVYLNVGTESEPLFDDFFYAQSDGMDLACSGSGCMGCFPRLVHWDGDGLKDLLVGQSDGTIKIFLNVGTEEEPVFDGGQDIMVGSGGMGVFRLDVGSRATPSLVDWNGDGALDLVSGAYDGRIHVFANDCNDTMPPCFDSSSVIGELILEDEGALAVPGSRSSPVVVDLDGDGLHDLLAGNTYGQILFYANIGTAAAPAFSGYTAVTSEGQAIDLAGSARSRPDVCTWTGDGHFGPKDGYWDLLVGSGDGKVRLYRGIPMAGDFDTDGDIDVDDLRTFMEAWRHPDPPADSLADLNGDGVLDYLDLEAFIDLMLAANPPKEAAPVPVVPGN